MAPSRETEPRQKLSVINEDPSLLADPSSLDILFNCLPLNGSFAINGPEWDLVTGVCKKQLFKGALQRLT